ncbi:hypothetical protein [Clostridium akagii]|uniref:hypothetical protein n=1 Tax=Clostridium akagii TaxID=91623 RepID=UPI000A9C36A3|nr:hypothetical protein [Clostridium akagii]
MGEISNITNISQSTNIQMANNFTLQVGQVITAKVVSSNKGDNEVILKLSDGKQINAKLDGAVDLNLNGQNKFVVKGYENGEIVIAKVTTDINESSMDKIIKQTLGNNISSEDYSMIKSLVKYGVPLTKENILYAKTILDFQSNVIKNPLKADEFIDIYLRSRGITENSDEANEVGSILKNFISELKSSNIQEIATFIENRVDLSGENIKSFNNVFKGDSSVFNSLSDIKNEILKLPTEKQSINLIDTKINPKINSIISLVIEGNSKGGGIMAGISNVNRQGNTENKYTRKLSFEVGDTFGARVDSYDEEKGEAVLKLSDGWKFNAKLDGAVNLTENSLSKFAVEGYEDGKIIIKKLVADDTNKSQDDTLNSVLKEYGGENLTGEDYTMLKTLLQHNIPLTKENISFSKTVMEFRNSIMENPENEDKFISSYLASKGIDESSTEGQNIKSSVKNFFTELKSFSTEEIATFVENGIDLTDENIKSFNNVFGNDSKINNELQELKQEIQKVFNPKDVIAPSKTSLEDITNIIEGNNINKTNNISDSKAIMEQINSKMSDMKDTIKQLTGLGDLNKAGMEKIFNALSNNLNDFKVFNTMSEGYYYMDVPVNYKDKDYNCKLIVKDDRKRGKKIDSKNVKLATSIKTANMGVVDAFITVNNKNLSVDIKSEGKWIKVLESAKNVLMNNVGQMGYNVNISVDEKKQELNIVSCRNFFNSEIVGKLDKRV